MQCCSFFLLRVLRSPAFILCLMDLFCRRTNQIQTIHTNPVTIFDSAMEHTPSNTESNRDNPLVSPAARSETGSRQEDNQETRDNENLRETNTNHTNPRVSPAARSVTGSRREDNQVGNQQDILISTQSNGETNNDTNYIINVTQINLHNNKTAWDTLTNFIKRDNLPLILATEPYSYNSNNLPKVHKDLIKFYHKGGNGKNNKPRAAILVHKNLEKYCWIMPEFSNRDQVVINLNINNINFIIASIYMDGRADQIVPPPSMEPLVTYADNKRATLIIGSDTNCRHMLWGDRLSNNRGEDLLNYNKQLQSLMAQLWFHTNICEHKEQQLHHRPYIS